MAEREDRDKVERPADGPGRGEPGGGGEKGRTSQDKPGRPDDTNERADDRARVVEPGSGKESPRAAF